MALASDRIRNREVEPQISVRQRQLRLVPNSSGRLTRTAECPIIRPDVREPGIRNLALMSWSMFSVRPCSTSGTLAFLQRPPRREIICVSHSFLFFYICPLIRAYCLHEEGTMGWGFKPPPSALRPKEVRRRACPPPRKTATPQQTSKINKLDRFRPATRRIGCCGFGYSYSTRGWRSAAVRGGVIGSPPTDNARSGMIGGRYRGAPIGRRERRDRSIRTRTQDRSAVGSSGFANRLCPKCQGKR